MLDVRVYRSAFLPAVLALFVAAFSLADRPGPATSRLATDAFDAGRAFGTGDLPPKDSLRGMALAFADHRAGSSGDVALAGLVARTFRAPDPDGGRSQYQVQRTVTSGRTASGRGDLVTVTATRPGLSSRRVVVIAARDGAGRPGTASLSGTAALLELSRDFRARDLRKTLVLVSTSGSSTGFAGARAWAQANAGAPVDAVIVLGDMASRAAARPWVVPWPASPSAPPLRLQRTLESALRTETGSGPGAARAAGQWARRALPVTVSAQGTIAAAGLPAVVLSASGERGPAPNARVSAARLAQFGRAALRAVTAIDAAGPTNGSQAGLSEGTPGIVTMRNVLPDWAVRLLIGTALLPALLAALDGFFRARRRHVPIAPWARWLVAAAVPVAAAWLWARLLGLTGALAAPDAPVLPRAFPLRAAGIAALASVPIVAALSWWLVAWLLHVRRRRGVAAAGGGLGAALGVLICALAALTWIPNPYAAALLLPAAHLWLLAAAPETRLRGAWGWAVLASGVALPAVLVLYFALALGLGPLGMAWTALLAAAGGAGMWSALVLAGFVAALAGLVRLLLARRAIVATAGGGPDLQIRTRGPLTYAGPGSLGGTESALRR